MARFRVEELPSEQVSDDKGESRYASPYLLVIDEVSPDELAALPEASVLAAQSGARGVIMTPCTLDRVPTT